MIGQKYGLKLGDTILDPRGMVYIQSIKALVCSGLRAAVASSNKTSLKELTKNLNQIIEQYKPEALIIICSLQSKEGLEWISKNLANKIRVIFVSKKPSQEVEAALELMKFETHKELVWDKYRFIEFFETPPFVDPSDMQALDFQFLTLSSGANYFVRIGKAQFDPLGLFSGEKLGVFLRGLGRLKIPSLDTKVVKTSLLSAVENPFFHRYDVFAVGHSRILPLGKLSEVEKLVSLNSLPVTKKVLGRARKKTVAKQVNSQLPH